MIWEIDSTHSDVSFAIRVMSVTTTRGRFKTFRGQLHIDEQHPASSWVDAQVEAASIDTHNKLRDTHPRSAAFFDVKKYPTITFQSTRVEHVGAQNYQVTGNLTLHGITRPITFDVQYHGSMMGTRTALKEEEAIMLERALRLCAEMRFLPLMERRKSSISTHYYLQAFNQSSKFGPWECQDYFAGSQAHIGARANATEAYRG